MLTVDEVIWGYRYILGHDPDAHAIEVHRHQADVATFRRILLGSFEFRSLGIGPYAETRWVLAPGPHETDRIWVDVADRMVGHDVIQGSFEPGLTRLFSRLVRPGDRVVDVGANVGWYTLLAAGLVGESGHVTAFEPNPVIAERLSRSVAESRHEGRVTVVAEALSDEAGVSVLARPRRVANFGNAFLFAEADEASYERHPVRLSRLDEAGIGRVDVVKIDCEGAEVLAMRGAAATLAAHRPLVMTEIFDAQLALVSRSSAAAYMAMMSEWSYSGYLIDDASGEVQRLPAWIALPDRDHANVLFVPSERAAEFRPLVEGAG